MSNSFVRYLLEGNNYPSNGQVVFDSSDHIRFQNGQNVSGHNYGCNRRLVIEKTFKGMKVIQLQCIILMEYIRCGKIMCKWLQNVCI